MRSRASTLQVDITNCATKNSVVCLISARLLQIHNWFLRLKLMLLYICSNKYSLSCSSSSEHHISVPAGSHAAAPVTHSATLRLALACILLWEWCMELSTPVKFIWNTFLSCVWPLHRQFSCHCCWCTHTTSRLLRPSLSTFPQMPSCHLSTWSTLNLVCHSVIQYYFWVTLINKILHIEATVGLKPKLLHVPNLKLFFPSHKT